MLATSRVVIVRVRRQPERDEDLHLVEARDHRLHVARPLHGVDVGQKRLDRRQPERVDARLVHARAVVVGDLLLDAPLRPVLPDRHLVEDRLQLVLGRLPRRPAPAPARHRGGDRIGGPPGAVRIVVEVAARIDALIHVAHVHAAQMIRVAERRRAPQRQKQQDPHASHVHRSPEMKFRRPGRWRRRVPVRAHSTRGKIRHETVPGSPP
jgi:hypothetical protein